MPLAESFDQRSSFDCRGARNTFGGAPSWATGRLRYEHPLGVVKPAKMLRIASCDDFDRCWPVCGQPALCAALCVCLRERTRNERVLRVYADLHGYALA